MKVELWALVLTLSEFIWTNSCPPHFPVPLLFSIISFGFPTSLFINFMCQLDWAQIFGHTSFWVCLWGLVFCCFIYFYFFVFWMGLTFKSVSWVKQAVLQKVSGPHLISWQANERERMTLPKDERIPAFKLGHCPPPAFRLNLELNHQSPGLQLADSLQILRVANFHDRINQYFTVFCVCV